MSFDDKLITCVDVDRKGNLAEPTQISWSHFEDLLHSGEEFRRVEKIGCRWEVGTSITDVETLNLELRSALVPSPKK